MVPGIQQGQRLIRVAFTLIGGRHWTGGYNYLLNLGRVLAQHAPGRLQPVFFFGEDVPEQDVAPFLELGKANVVRDLHFDESRKTPRMIKALLTGNDLTAAGKFLEQRIDVVFESAQFFGWRFPLPTVAWIPDFQHRHLKHLFGTGAYWKREAGFLAQVGSGRRIMLSSQDACQDCERFYPATRGRTHVVRFAVPAPRVDAAAARAVADHYGLPQPFFFLPNQFWVHKNHECVIRALQIVKQRKGDVVVAVSGAQLDPRNPGHVPRLLRLVHDLGVEDSFRILGLIPYEHLSSLMRACAALINPSYFEGWSTTVEEAKSLGTRMLLSSLGVHKEQAGKAAVFFDPASPAQLAEALMRYQHAAGADSEQSRRLAAEDANRNVKQFSDDFVQLAELAACDRWREPA